MAPQQPRQPAPAEFREPPGRSREGLRAHLALEAYRDAEVRAAAPVRRMAAGEAFSLQGSRAADDQDSHRALRPEEQADNSLASRSPVEPGGGSRSADPGF